MTESVSRTGLADITPTVIPRSEHGISRASISEGALKVLYRLKDSGYQAHLVGGGVRDLLLGREPKDFDVATDATPEEVKAVFRNSRLIGRRFRLAHVRFGREIIEVATFRGLGEAAGGDDRINSDGMIVADNHYGTIEEDALRRDFTINALYYNIADFSLVDYAGGLRDLREGRIRLLGDPESRYREDPVRMLRAARFAAKLGFQIDPASEAPIYELGQLLDNVPPARLYEEVLKLFLGGAAVTAFEKLRHYDLFERLFPDTDEALSHEEHEFPLTLVLKGLENTDARIAEGKPVTPAFLFAVLLWEPTRRLAERLQEQGLASHPALQEAAGTVVERQITRVSIPRRFSVPMREIWALQSRLTLVKGKRPQRLAAHPRFRAAYDFLVLRAAAGEADPELADWWARFQRQENPETDADAKPARRRRRGRRGGRARSASAAEENS